MCNQRKDLTCDVLHCYHHVVLVLVRQVREIRDGSDFSQRPDGPVLNDDFCPSMMVFPTVVILHPGSQDFIFLADVRFEH